MITKSYLETQLHNFEELILDGKYVRKFATLPTPSALWNNKIVQFTGTTTATYTNGYFYKCVLRDGDYVWTNIPVQDIPGIVYVRPEDYGAVGDGTTDDTTAVNQAIAAAASARTYVKFAPKTYIVNNITFVSHMVLVGDNTVITTNENMTARITGSRKTDVLITGITFDNFGQLNPTYARRWTITNCKFINYKQQVLFFQWSQKITIRDCLFDNIGAEITSASDSGKAIVVQGRTEDDVNNSVTDKITKLIDIENCEFSRIYGGKAIKIDKEVSGFLILNNYFHDLTYGAIGAWDHACDEDCINIISGNRLYNIGTFDVAPGDTSGQTSASGATAIYAYSRVTTVDGQPYINNHLNIIVTHNILQNLVENAIEGAFKEIAYNTIDTTGIDVGRYSGKGGIYVPYTTHNIHHNKVTNCLNSGRGISVNCAAGRGHGLDIRIVGNTVNNIDGDNCIRVQGYLDNIYIQDNEIDKRETAIEITPHNEYPNLQKFYYREPIMPYSYQRIRYEEGMVDIEGDTTNLSSWQVSGTVIKNADGNMLLAKGSSITQKLERNITEAPIGERAYAVVAITYSFHDLLDVDNVLKIKITDDTTGENSRTRVNVKGLYETSADLPAEKTFYTRYYILSSNNVGKVMTCQVLNTSSNTGNIEIKNVQFKMVRGINTVANQLNPLSLTIAENSALGTNTNYITELQTKLAGADGDYVLKMRDVITNENYYVSIINGRFVGFSESQLNAMLSNNNP